MTNQLEEKHQRKNFENLFAKRRINLIMSRILRNGFMKKIILDINDLIVVFTSLHILIVNTFYWKYLWENKLIAQLAGDLNKLTLDVGTRKNPCFFLLCWFFSKSRQLFDAFGPWCLAYSNNLFWAKCSKMSIVSKVIFPLSEGN